jgi:hypothetical protein
MSKAGRRAPERLGLTDVSGFRPVDADDVYRRRIGGPVRKRAARVGTAHVSSVGLRSVGRNAFQADNQLMIPQFESVNRKKFGAAQNSSRPFSRLRLRVLPASRRDSRPVKWVYVMSANHHRDVLLGLRSMPASGGVRAFRRRVGAPPVRPFTAFRPTGAIRPMRSFALRKLKGWRPAAEQPLRTLSGQGPRR